VKGIVIKSTGSWYLVRLIDGDIVKSRLKGKFRNKFIDSTNPIVVGDKVVLEKDENDFMISELLDRKNIIVRKSVNLSKRNHLIASNIDQAILFVTINYPKTSTTFIDRFLVSANAFGVDVIIVINKIDLYNQNEIISVDKLETLYSKIGYKCLSISILNDSLDILKDLLSNKTTLVSGHSGVGKSTLINKLIPNLNIKTKEVSSLYNLGKHTTTFSELYELNLKSNIIDTPGIKGFGLTEIKRNEISKYFNEFLNIQSKCKFHNCLHINEPDCMIRQEISKGNIAKSRYKSYLNMLSEEDR
tara:strand:+ start:8326 stop:9231 length:906 start_codon:yes stop_codon:yes gene_type:complete